jgi:hypothetical protein
MQQLLDALLACGVDKPTMAPKKEQRKCWCAGWASQPCIDQPQCVAARKAVAARPADDGEPVTLEEIEAALKNTDATVSASGGHLYADVMVRVGNRGELNRLCAALGVPLRAGEE